MDLKYASVCEGEMDIYFMLSYLIYTFLVCAWCTYTFLHMLRARFLVMYRNSLSNIMRCERPRGTVVSQWREPSGTYHLPFESFELCHVAIQLHAFYWCAFYHTIETKSQHVRFDRV